jgi:hypothetical protein
VSKSSVQQVIQKAVSDAAFRRQLQREPAVALSGFDLTADERASITTGDPTRLTALGVDQRMSKAFALGAAADASTPVNSTAIDNPGTAGTAAFIDEGSVAGSNSPEGLVGDITSGATSVFASDATSGATAVIPGDPTVGAAAFEGVDTTGDMNVIDPGMVEGPQVAGTQVTIDDGQPTTAFETDSGSALSANDAVTGGDDMGIAPSVDTSFDGHVTIDDGTDSHIQ